MEQQPQECILPNLVSGEKAWGVSRSNWGLQEWFEISNMSFGLGESQGMSGREDITAHVERGGKGKQQCEMGIEWAVSGGLLRED